MEEKLVRDELIEKAENIYGERLVRKVNKTMETYYLDVLKRGRGVFWVDLKKVVIEDLEFISKKLGEYVKISKKEDMEGIL